MTFSIIYLAHRVIGDVQKYSSGWRGAPAKGIDGLRRARVQIPPSALDEKEMKKFLTSKKTYDNIYELRLTKKLWKRNKKVLDNSWLDVIRYQSCCKRETKTTSKKVEKTSWQAENNMI